MNTKYKGVIGFAKNNEKYNCSSSSNKETFEKMRLTVMDVAKNRYTSIFEFKFYFYDPKTNVKRFIPNRI